MNKPFGDIPAEGWLGHSKEFWENLAEIGGKIGERVRLQQGKSHESRLRQLEVQLELLRAMVDTQGELIKDFNEMAMTLHDNLKSIAKMLESPNE